MGSSSVSFGAGVGTFAVAGLQEPEFAFLNGEFHILPIAPIFIYTLEIPKILCYLCIPKLFAL
jgi:hypothetical protein